MSRLSIANEYVDRYRSETVAIQRFVADLMRGDPATFKQGYTRENAVIATAEAFGTTEENVERIVPA